jgi:hypothetical protein
MRHLSVSLAVAAAPAVAACGTSEPPPPPPKVEAPKPAAPTVDEEMKRLAAEVYVYAYPMVLMEATRNVQTAGAAVNTFHHRHTVPDETTTDVDYPNADFLYSQAWLDLSKEPVVLSVPDTKGRYYLIALLDAWTNVAGSIGKRTIGTEKREFVLVGPRFKGEYPAALSGSEIKVPTELAWLFARTEVKGKPDMAAAMKVQDQMLVTPLSEWKKRRGKPVPGPAQAGVDVKTEPHEQVAKMDAQTFLTRVAMLLPGNPPAKEDAPMLDKIKKLGLVPGQPFDLSKLQPLAATSVQAGIKEAHDRVEEAGKRGISADVRNGWSIDRELGRWGVDYGKRAVSAWIGLGANAPEDAIFMYSRFDGGGQRLDGANGYVLHFDKGKLPPADGFWSVSVYDDKKHFVANPLHRYNLGSDDALKTNADGSLDLYLQNADPGGDKQANWIPVPKQGPFIVVLRVYWPKDEVVQGRWSPPGIRKAG